MIHAQTTKWQSPLERHRIIKPKQEVESNGENSTLETCRQLILTFLLSI